MGAEKRTKTPRYRFWVNGLEVLEWAHNCQAELHYLCPERKLVKASERARKVRSQLWSVSDEEERYFHLFPHPVPTTKALKVFFETARYEDGEAKTYPALVVPYAFTVEAWNARRVQDSEVREEMRRGWYYGGWPFEEGIAPKATFLAAVWFTSEVEK